MTQERPEVATLARPRAPDWAPPDRLSALTFAFKTSVFRAQRSLAEIGSRPKRLKTSQPAQFTVVLAESRTSLWSDPRLAERAMQLGKVQNLRRAAQSLDRLELKSGSVFSFWRQIGKTTRRRGYVDGRMLQQGCLVPAIGGGLCQLSNALYDVALKSGCEIVERHAHSRIVPGSVAALGRDATVAWNYVDLRFSSTRPAMLRVRIERDDLVVQLLGADAHVAAVTSHAGDGKADTREAAQSCATCDETSCFKHELPHTVPAGRTAYLVDDYWPEFGEYLAMFARPNDVLGLPIDGARWKLPRYGWSTKPFARVVTATVQTLVRSVTSRRLAAQGAARQTAQLRAAEALAARLARVLTPDVTTVCVAQSLLPFLWRDGHLAARSIRVLMTRLPMGVLQDRLDAAAKAHAESPTLADFRAPAELVLAEEEALAAADALITPHAEIAALFGDRAIKLEWKRPKAALPTSAPEPRRVAFVGPTAGRKGAYEMRAAARALDLDVRLMGSDLEGQDFWKGVLSHRAPAENWLDGVALVVQPAYLEDKPRRLLAALAAGVPVIATQACGLEPQAGLTLVPAGDAHALAKAIQSALS